MTRVRLPSAAFSGPGEEELEGGVLGLIAADDAMVEARMEVDLDRRHRRVERREGGGEGAGVGRRDVVVLGAELEVDRELSAVAVEVAHRAERLGEPAGVG